MTFDWIWLLGAQAPCSSIAIKASHNSSVSSRMVPHVFLKLTTTPPYHLPYDWDVGSAQPG